MSWSKIAEVPYKSVLLSLWNYVEIILNVYITCSQVQYDQKCQCFPMPTLM